MDDGGLVVGGKEVMEHFSFVAGFAGFGLVAAHEDGGVVAGLLEALVEPLDDGGFSGAAGGDVADADDGAGEAFDGDVGVVEGVAEAGGGGVEGGAEGGEGSEGGCAEACCAAAEDLVGVVVEGSGQGWRG